MKRKQPGNQKSHSSLFLQKRKGQMSLEMIIGLVILLVVASVVISLFLNVFEEPDVGQQTVKKQDIKKTCGSLCTDWKKSDGRAALSAAIDYCQRTFQFDKNGDGNLRQTAGSGFNSYCENGVHCFNIHTCDSGFTRLNYEKCRELMCSFYINVNGDPYSLEKEGNVHDHIASLFSPENEETGVGSCGLENLEDSAGYKISTWYNQKDAKYDFYQGDQNQLKEGDSSGGAPAVPGGAGGSRSDAALVCEEQFKQNSFESGGN